MIKIISNSKNWMEDSAIKQLETFSKLDGIIDAVGLPDLHPGKVPVGAVFVSKGKIYPHLVGNDIACGMAFFKTQIDKRKAKYEKWEKRLNNMENFRDIDISDYKINEEIEDFKSLGSIGGGNHFAEIQEIKEVFNEEVFLEKNLDKSKLYLLIHSGSRRHGQSLLEYFIKEYKAQNGLVEGTKAFNEYLEKHNKLDLWASENRRLIAFKFLKAIGVKAESENLINNVHNSLRKREEFFLHRKGAGEAENGDILIIPGSRGTLSYLVKVLDSSKSAYSIAHGAGRKWDRSLCKYKLERQKRDTFKRTKDGNRVIYKNKNLFYEEAPQAYKNIKYVIESLIEEGIIELVASLKPVISFKA